MMMMRDEKANRTQLQIKHFFSNIKCKYFISPQKHVGTRKRLGDASKEYPQHKFLWRNRENIVAAPLSGPLVI